MACREEQLLSEEVGHDYMCALKDLNQKIFTNSGYLCDVWYAKVVRT